MTTGSHHDKSALERYRQIDRAAIAAIFLEAETYGQGIESLQLLIETGAGADLTTVLVRHLAFLVRKFPEAADHLRSMAIGREGLGE